MAVPELGGRHPSPPQTLAFSPDGTRIATISEDKVVIRGLDGSQVEEVPRSFFPSFARLVWRDDGSLVLVDPRATERVRGDGPWTNISQSAGVAVDSETTRLAAADGTGLRWIAVDGTLGERFGEVPVLKERDRFALRGSRVLILPTDDNEPKRIYDLTSRRIVRELGFRPKILEGVLLAGQTAVLVGESSYVHVLDGTRVTNLGIKANRPPMAAPVARQVAFATTTYGEVLVYDIDRDAIVLRGNLHAQVNAVAWSRDGTRLAAVGSSGEVRVWTVAAAR